MSRRVLIRLFNLCSFCFLDRTYGWQWQVAAAFMHLICLEMRSAAYLSYHRLNKMSLKNVLYVMVIFLALIQWSTRNSSRPHLRNISIHYAYIRSSFQSLNIINLTNSIISTLNQNSSTELYIPPSQPL